MNTEKSLQSLLQTLVNSPEEDKRALTRAAVGMLREVCNIHLGSPYTKFQTTAEAARFVLDQVLIGNLEDTAEEEFLESGDLAVTEEKPKLEVPSAPIVIENASPLYELIRKWNSKMEPWFQITIPPCEGVDSIRLLIEGASAIRSNLLSAASVSKPSNKEEVKRFEKYWKLWGEEIVRQGYTVFPEQFGRLDALCGEVIYSCRPNLTQEEIALMMPGLKKGEEVLLKPVTLVTLPAEMPFPPDHPDKDLPPQWRAIMGEIELLLKHLQIQTCVVCAIEGVNKNRIEPLSQCKEAVIHEIKRRADALKNAILHQESIYRLATNYWRVEECFWSIFHNDDRPYGYSFFSRMRRRIQSWHPVIRQSDQLYIRNFDAGKDSIASINKYIGNILLQSKQGVPPGTILRELRPATIVKVNNITRLLKGRVIAT